MSSPKIECIARDIDRAAAPTVLESYYSTEEVDIFRDCHARLPKYGRSRLRASTFSLQRMNALLAFTLQHKPPCTVLCFSRFDG